MLATKPPLPPSAWLKLLRRRRGTGTLTTATAPTPVTQPRHIRLLPTNCQSMGLPSLRSGQAGQLGSPVAAPRRAKHSDFAGLPPLPSRVAGQQCERLPPSKKPRSVFLPTELTAPSMSCSGLARNGDGMKKTKSPPTRVWETGRIGTAMPKIPAVGESRARLPWRC